MQQFVKQKVQDAMTKEVISVNPKMPIEELEKLFEKHGFNMFPVLEAGRLVGVVSEYDFLKVFIVFGSDLSNPKPYEQIAKRKTVKDIYSDPLTVRNWHPLTYVLELMAKTMRKSYVVLNDEGAMVGVIARRDLIKQLKT